MDHRAYALLDIKQADDDARIITGIASTPSTDMMDDIVEPDGAEFKLPIPLLWQHDSRQPIGHVTRAKVTKDGIEIRAQIVKLAEPGKLKDRVDEAWQSIKSGLVGGLSIGFKALETAHIEGTFGVRFIKWLWLELSAVTIPANQEATITSIKSIDSELLAASGHEQSRADSHPGGVTPSRSKVVKAKEAKTMAKKTIAEQISSFEATRASKAAQMDEVMDEPGDKGETLDASQKEAFDALEAEIKEIDEHIKRLRVREKLNKEQAKPVDGTDPDAASASRGGGNGSVAATVKVPDPGKGIAFTRVFLAKANASLLGCTPLAFAESREHWKSTPEVMRVLKTAVAAGTTTDTTWAAPLVEYQILASEFAEYLRPLTIIGRIQGFRRVPFKVKIPRQTAGASVNWVGEGKVKPLTSLAFDSITLDFTKIAGIIPLTEELVRLSNPSAEALVRDDLARAIAQFADREFVDPSKALAAGVSPASITNGVSAIAATGTTSAAFRADVKSLFTELLEVNQSPAGGVWIMTQGQALALSLMQNALSQPEFPGMSINGGTLLGFPVVASENIPSTSGSPADGYPIIFLLANEVLLADDGQVSIDVSREASLQMDTAPDSPATASTVMVSLWQHNMIAIRAERWINWVKRRSEAAQYISSAKYAE